MFLSLQLALQAIEFSEVEDAELVELFVATRGERYFAELYQRYSPKVYARCSSMLGDDVEANDAVQDIFERVLMRFGSFRRDAKFSTWLFRITSNHCIDCIRRRKTARSRELELDEGLPLEDGSSPDDGDWLELQSADAVEHILKTLGDLDRASLVLKYMDGLPVKEIADTLQLGESATKMRLKRARTRARKIYDAWLPTQALSA